KIRVPPERFDIAPSKHRIEVVLRDVYRIALELPHQPAFRAIRCEQLDRATTFFVWDKNRLVCGIVNKSEPRGGAAKLHLELVTGRKEFGNTIFIEVRASIEPLEEGCESCSFQRTGSMI